MSKKEISLTEALLLKKRYKKRITDMIISKRNKTFNTAIIVQGDVATVSKDVNGKDIEERKKEIKSSLQSIEALVKNYETLCRAIAQANASTEVEFGNEKFTIAEIIGMKASGIDVIYENIYEYLAGGAATIERTVAESNERTLTQEAMTSYMKAVLPENAGKEDREATSNTFFKEFKFSSIECISKDTIEKYSTRSNDFSDAINFKLAIINASTIITVEFED